MTVVTGRQLQSVAGDNRLAVLPISFSSIRLLPLLRRSNGETTIPYPLIIQYPLIMIWPARVRRKRQRLRPNPRIASAPAGNARVHAGARRRRTCR